MTEPSPTPLPSPPSIKIAVIGDIHDAWDEEDPKALERLGVDLALFVGDFGNEAVEVVRAVSTLALPYAASFGNHDAWYTATPWGTKHCPYDRTQEDWVSLQIDLLAEAHVGYTHRVFPQLDLSVVGGRPFSWGGPDWRCAEFYRDRFGVKDFDESMARIVDAAAQAPSETILFLGHNGPAGLGDQAEDPCGKDWKQLGGDFGDPDLRDAIATTRSIGKRVPLVAFGHMHHNLRHTKAVQRKRLCVDEAGTVYLNAACVPRIIKTQQGLQRNFSLVTLQNHQVTEVKLAWVDAAYDITSSETLYAHAPPPTTVNQSLVPSSE
ncbi:TIGR04168 family protein [Acaryochloris sp. IP29b_bin.137]|uniref:TIGR04168 family protein n=1 Tax=Acaryochloris sp. IP29b_bin.137 TaxID=2969217 RepID=UPI0026137F2C|nr:TIGR04168 family protein [Acaryochloris sp. IP29b_bin.137]